MLGSDMIKLFRDFWKELFGSYHPEQRYMRGKK